MNENMESTGRLTKLQIQVEEREKALSQYRSICEKQAMKIADMEKNSRSRSKSEFDKLQQDFESAMTHQQELQSNEQQLRVQNGKLQKQIENLDTKFHEMKYV
jgi:hypothetical protein